ncbi:MAG TPA: sigma-70 family RNA polymerase sigma factor, partial [Longimicrobium sp.]|nr:sigma-70 family RNA polymerase sigma factor [Longimicrobium sp.]
MERANAESDAALVARARRGDALAFDALVRRHMRAAYAVALAGVGEPADAEDVCQDAFVSALERIEDCREPEKFAGWLLQIVRNRAHNHRRYRAVRDALPLEAAERAGGRGDTPLRHAERGELQAHLLAALARLPLKQREIVMLHDVEGLKHAEIGARLGISEVAARVHLHHAR